MKRRGSALAIALSLLVFACTSPDRPRPGPERDGTAAQPARPTRTPAPTAPPRPVGIRPEVVRAVWVDAWGSGFETAERCDQLLAWCEERGLNTILLQVRRTGDAFHDGAIEPRGRIGSIEIAADFDPLQYLVQRARDEKGMRLEAWIVANRLWQGDAAPPASSPAHLLQSQPDWLMMNRAGETVSADDKAARYLDPCLPEVRAHVARVAADIARRYRVDAIHLDYIRYPEQDWGYGQASLERFRRDERRSDFPATSDEGFVAWRARQVELEVREIRTAVRLASPDCELSAAVVIWGEPPADGDFSRSAGYRSAAQDWPSWCEKGLIDLVYPMHYRRDDDPKQNAIFRAWLDRLVALPRGRARMVLGLGAYLNDRAGLAAQIAALGSRPGLSGYALFSYRHPRR